MNNLNLKNIKIRNVEKKDAAELIQYLYQIGKESDYLTFGEGELNITLEQEEAIIQSKSGDNNLFIVAEVNGKIVGNLNFRGGARPRTKHTGEFGISVLKEYWNSGIATALITYLINWAKETKTITKINLKARSDNEKAIYLYTKLGFKKEGLITRDFLINGKYYDSIAMGLELD